MGKQRLCLVIEDDPDIRGLIATVLEGAGFKVLAVDSGTTGIAAVARAASSLSLITLDLGLPDMDGHDVARTLRAMTSAPLLFLTARAEEDDVLSGLASGAAAYVTKPFLPKTLTETALSLSRLHQDANHPEPAATPAAN